MQVCRRWRNLAITAPRRLRLRLQCTQSNHFEAVLDIWPTLPIVISDHRNAANSGVGSVIAALERNDRVCKIELRGDPVAANVVVKVYVRERVWE